MKPSSHADTKIVAVKFCGGCNPTYERGQFFESIRKAAADKITWVRADNSKVDALLVICGCPAACPEKTCNSDSYEKCIVIRNGQPTPEEIVKEIYKYKAN
ncbi:MAG: hypothetical protein CSYNP_03455 [Syntrophus sp. SKADARSKE-3]|nr:hypothetical protein [Syntrophus sp. SKADARSKE-3]